MPALHALPARLTLADMHVELTHDRPTRDLRLELLGEFGLDQWAVTMRTVVG